MKEPRDRPKGRSLFVGSAVVLALLIGGFAVVWLVRRDHGGGRLAAQPSTAVVVPAPKPGGRSLTTELARLAALGRPVYCGSTRRREFALTFDDGPGRDTPLALRILTRARVPATFFDVGKVIIRWPAQLPRELRAGALGEHTWTHRYLPSLRPAEIEQELMRTKKLIESITHRPVRLFRPPYGALSQTVQAEVRELRMVDVLWSVDSRDWAGAKWNQIAAKVLREIRPGSIVLMHENRGQTLRALKYVILPRLDQRGLRPVSVPQLLANNPPSPSLLRSGLPACLREARFRRSG
jgi:peptidoglycan/xylan/chitin deacetylase (PgdA/CDA1 family)